MSFWLILLLCAHVVQVYFWLWAYNRRPKTSRDTTASHQDLPGVSVVIAAKNESENLTRHLPGILNQDYPKYEVILINDQSTDGSDFIINDFLKEYPQLVSFSTVDKKGKKNALSLGIQNAKYPWILCTDADCNPNSEHWIKSMIRTHANADLILGYGPYQPCSSFLNAFIEYETWYIAVQYMSAALQNCAYMGVGRNLCFRKSAWEEVGGYQSHKELRSGDDDLLVSALASKRVQIETDPKSWVFSIPSDSIKKLWQQKRRHLSTAASYSLKHQVLLFFSFASVLLVYSLTVFHCAKGNFFVLIPLIVRWIYMYFVSYGWMKSLGVMRLWPSIPFWDFLLVVYYFIHGVFFWRQKTDW